MSFDFTDEFGSGSMPHGMSGSGRRGYQNQRDAYANIPRAASSEKDNGWLSLIWQIFYPLCLGLLNFVMVVGAWLWFKHPLYAYRFLLRFNLYRAGFILRYVKLDGAYYRIAERGRADSSRSSLLLIHGFGNDLSQWCQLANYFDINLDHLIVVDLPGHGSSQIAKDEDFDLEALAHRVTRILEASSVLSAGQSLHIIGQDMGGALAALMAVHWSEKVELITLICPTMESAEDNEFLRRMKAGDFSWLVPETLDQLRIMFRRVCYQPVSMPGQLMQGLLEHHLQRNEFCFALLQNLFLQHNCQALANHAADITCPCQIIWGRQDEISPVANAEVLRNKLSHCEQQRVDLLDEVGHDVNMEASHLLCRNLALFRKDQELKKYK